MADYEVLEQAVHWAELMVLTTLELLLVMGVVAMLAAGWFVWQRCSRAPPRLRRQALPRPELLYSIHHYVDRDDSGQLRHRRAVVYVAPTLWLELVCQLAGQNR